MRFGFVTLKWANQTSELGPDRYFYEDLLVPYSGDDADLIGHL
jgi:hypothetical protein